MKTFASRVRVKDHPRIFLLLFAGVWGALYFNLQGAASHISGWLPETTSISLKDSLEFFLFEVPKVFLLLVGIVLIMGIINTWFTPERTRALLSGRGAGSGNILAALLGTVTPFCSCSAVPLFIGLNQAGVPLGVSLSFLISAPMVNEIALGMLFAMFGWRIALIYMGMGLTLAISAGWLLGTLKLERYLEDWVQNLQASQAQEDIVPMAFGSRVLTALQSVQEIVGKIWPYLILGIGAGALIHGYVPEAYLASLLGSGDWWSVPLSVVIGVPLYSNAVGIIPIVEALLAKGIPLGTALAFMMSVIALSFPEMLILRKVLKVQLLFVFVFVVAMGIIATGYIFNLLM